MVKTKAANMYCMYSISVMGKKSWNQTHFFSFSLLRLVGDEVLANKTRSSIPDKPHGAVGDITNPQFAGRWHGL